MSGTQRSQDREQAFIPEPRPETEVENPSPTGPRMSNRQAAQLAERIRGARQDEHEMVLPDVRTDSEKAWHGALRKGFNGGLLEVVKSIKREPERPRHATRAEITPERKPGRFPADYADLGHDVGATPDYRSKGGDLGIITGPLGRFAGEVATNLAKTGYDELGGKSGVLDLAKEYPVPAALVAVAAGYAVTEYIGSAPELKLKVSLEALSDDLSMTVKHDLDSGESGVKFDKKFSDRLKGSVSHDTRRDDTRFLLRYRYTW